MLIATIDDTVARLHWNSFPSGSSITPGAARAPAAASRTTNVTPAAIQA
jgi:hypothetical protein